MDFLLSLYYVIPMSLCLFPLPSQNIIIISPPFTLAKLKQCFLWRKNTNAKDNLFPHGPKQVLNLLLQRVFTRSALAVKKDYDMSSPMINPGGLNATQALDNKTKNR